MCYFSKCLALKNGISECDFIHTTPIVPNACLYLQDIKIKMYNLVDPCTGTDEASDTESVQAREYISYIRCPALHSKFNAIIK